MLLCLQIVLPSVYNITEHNRRFAPSLRLPYLLLFLCPPRAAAAARAASNSSGDLRPVTLSAACFSSRVRALTRGPAVRSPTSPPIPLQAILCMSSQEDPSGLAGVATFHVVFRPSCAKAVVRKALTSSNSFTAEAMFASPKTLRKRQWRIWGT